MNDRPVERDDDAELIGRLRAARPAPDARYAAATRERVVREAGGSHAGSWSRAVAFLAAGVLLVGGAGLGLADRGPLAPTATPAGSVSSR